MLCVVSVLALSFAPPGNVLLVRTRQRHVRPLASADGLEKHVSERWKSMQSARDDPGAEVAKDEKPGELNSMELARDKKLAERDTRRWCLDRCMATGYCDAVEDLWEMSSQQVMKFCEQCASEDECELDYDKADEYMDHLVAGASWELADGGSGSIG